MCVWVVGGGSCETGVQPVHGSRAFRLVPVFKSGHGEILKGVRTYWMKTDKGIGGGGLFLIFLKSLSRRSCCRTCDMAGKCELKINRDGQELAL